MLQCRDRLTMYYAVNDEHVHDLEDRGVLHVEHEFIQFDEFGEIQ